jgi:hypothetical protein
MDWSGSSPNLLYGVCIYQFCFILVDLMTGQQVWLVEMELLTMERALFSIHETNLFLGFFLRLSLSSSCNSVHSMVIG